MSQPERFQKGQKVLITGGNGIPDRPATVESHSAASVWVRYTDDREPPSGWCWEGHVRPVPEEVFLDAESTHVPANLFDFEKAV